MYHIRRVYKTKPEQARKVATLAHLEAQILRDAGQRGESNGYFNPGTTPGEKTESFCSGMMTSSDQFLGLKMRYRLRPWKYKEN